MILARMYEDMQRLLDMVSAYTNANRYNINPSKSAILVYGRKRADDEATPNLNGENIPEVGETTHLGIIQGTASNLNKTRVDNNIELARKTLYSLMGVGMYGNSGLSPAIKIKIYNLYVLPRLLYGVTGWNKTDRMMKELNRFHIKSLKVIQGLPDRTADVGVLALAGALPLETTADRQQLSLLWNVLAHKDSYARKVIVRQYLMEVPGGWTMGTTKLLEMYNLPTICQLMQNLPPVGIWKRSVKKSC